MSDDTERLIDAALATDHYRHPAIDALAMHTRALRADLARVTAERDAAIERGHAALQNGMAATQERHDRMCVAEAERDALAVSLTQMREAARRFYAGMMSVSFEAGIYAERGSGPESGAVVAEAYSAADHCGTIIAATASPAEHGRKAIEEAEERGCGWGIEEGRATERAQLRAEAASCDIYLSAGTPAEVCLAAREAKR